MERLRRVFRHFYSVLRPFPTAGQSPLGARRDPLALVVVLDGTVSTLEPGEETNAGLAYRLLREVPGVAVYYEAGLQWQDWRATADVMLGRGINRQIRHAYGWLASRYHPGDQIFLMGYSRGAYAVRSLAGVIDRVGLLRAGDATERNIRTAYRHYQAGDEGDVSEQFAAITCHEKVVIEGIFVWDTVKALGLRLPLLWRWSAASHEFHDHQLGPSVRAGFQALAIDETRSVFEPVLWESRAGDDRLVQQLWFPGTHGDVGGQLGGERAARGLSNLALVWMLEKMEGCGLILPKGWAERFPVNEMAPSVGTWGGTGKLFWVRSRRVFGRDPSESLHPSVEARRAKQQARVWSWRRRA